MEMVNIKINGRDYSVPADSSVIDAARIAKIDIPTLCYLKGVNEIGACRLCLVEVKGARGLMAACVTGVTEGMEIFTNTPKVREARKTNLELVLSTHKKDCLSCIRSQSCELQRSLHVEIPKRSELHAACQRLCFAGTEPRRVDRLPSRLHPHTASSHQRRRVRLYHVRLLLQSYRPGQAARRDHSEQLSHRGRSYDAVRPAVVPLSLPPYPYLLLLDT